MALKEVFAPANYRACDKCKVFILTDDSCEHGELAGTIGVQVSLGEIHMRGTHAILTPDADGPIIRYTIIQPNGTVEVCPLNPSYERKTYHVSDVKFIGFVFQYIKNWETGERLEFIVGQLAGTLEESQYSRPLLKAN